MNRDEAVDLVRQYQEFCRAAGVPDPTLRDIADRWPEDGSERKAMRWLGFMQGALYAMGLLSLDDIKAQSRDRDVPLPEPRATECKSDAEPVAYGVADSTGRVRLAYEPAPAAYVAQGLNEWAVEVVPLYRHPLQTTECRSVSQAAELARSAVNWASEQPEDHPVNCDQATNWLLGTVAQIAQLLGTPGTAGATDCGSVARKEGE